MLWVGDKGDIDLILTDLQMPEMQGDELIKYAKEAGFSSRTILMTASDVCDTEPVADAFLQKPFTKQQLFVVIKRLFPEWSELS